MTGFHAVSRKESVLFVVWVVVFGISASAASAQENRLTARQVIASIQEQVGVPVQSGTVDTFKAGNPDTPVTGIAVTMMATFDVLQRAAEQGDNLIITHEPTFFNHLDKTDVLAQKESDAVLANKLAFIAQHGLVIWRFHDGWHRRRPDGILTGMVKALGWESYQSASNPQMFLLPAVTVEALAADIQKRLGIHVVRVVGNRGMTVTEIGLAPGAGGLTKQSALLESPDVEVLVAGESAEWETVEYVADAASEGKRKALILLGHVPSEQAGMEECARWLKTFVSGVRVDFVATREPF